MTAYKTINGREIYTGKMDDEERTILASLQEEADVTRHTRTKLQTLWTDFQMSAWTKIRALYDRRGLSPSKVVKTRLYRIATDLGSRIAIAAGMTSTEGVTDPTVQPKEWTHGPEDVRSVFDVSKDEVGKLYFSLQRIETTDSQDRGIIQQLKNRHVDDRSIVGFFTGLNDEGEELIQCLIEEHGSTAHAIFASIFEKAFLFARSIPADQQSIDMTPVYLECHALLDAFSSQQDRKKLHRLCNDIVSLGTYYGCQGKRKSFV